MPRFLIVDDDNRIKLEWGYLELSKNEISIISLVDDPPAVRMASISGISLGKISFGRLRPGDLRQVEMIAIQGKQDERTRDNPLAYAGEVTVHISKGTGDDDDMVKVIELRHDYGIFYGVRVPL